MLIKSTVLALIGAFALSLNAFAGDASKQAAAYDGKAKAVLIYADWCGSCRILDPKIKAVKESGDFELDYTARDEDAFYKAAKKAGVKKAVRSAFEGSSVKTGQLFLISPDGATILGKVTRDYTEADIAEAISKAAASV